MLAALSFCKNQRRANSLPPCIHLAIQINNLHRTNGKLLKVISDKLMKMKTKTMDFQNKHKIIQSVSDQVPTNALILSKREDKTHEASAVTLKV